MKTIRCLFAALVVAISVLGPVKVQGSVAPPPSLPVSIPTATNEIGLLDQLVGISSYPAFLITYTDTNGNHPSIFPLASPKTFPSYQVYRDYCTSNVLAGMDKLRTNSSYRADTNAPVEVFFDLTISTSLSAPDSLRVDYTASSFMNVTTNWLNGLTPNWSFFVYYEPGLQQVKITVNDGNVPYIWEWTNTATTTVQQAAPRKPQISQMVGDDWYYTQDTELVRKPSIQSYGIEPKTVSQHPPEYTQKNYLILNFWYLLRQFYARFFVVVSNQTDTYTQFGDPITQPVIQPEGTSLQVSWAAGANTTVELSTSLPPVWSDFQTMPTNSIVTNQVLDLSGIVSKPGSIFFRARSN